MPQIVKDRDPLEILKLRIRQIQMEMIPTPGNVFSASSWPASSQEKAKDAADHARQRTKTG